MKNLLFLLLISFSASLTVSAQSADPILGEWQSAKKDNRILIYKSGDKYYGKITWGSGEPKDVKNPDPGLRSRDLVNSIILKDVVKDGSNLWDQGTIYDPTEGKTYSCKITLKAPNELSIRGYVGISLFGKTVTYTRYHQ